MVRGSLPLGQKIICNCFFSHSMRCSTNFVNSIKGTPGAPAGALRAPRDLFNLKSTKVIAFLDDFAHNFGEKMPDSNDTHKNTRCRIIWRLPSLRGPPPTLGEPPTTVSRPLSVAIFGGHDQVLGS
ncbi:unnamed protein product, partial [Discosporangium mesarthrocarpum]